MFQYISIFQGFIAVTDSGRQELCFHKPGSPGSNARLISIFITYVQIMKSEPEHFDLDKKINTAIFILLQSQGCKKQVQMPQFFPLNEIDPSPHGFPFALIDILFTISDTKLI